MADEYARAGVAVGAGQLVLTASSSESYGFLFKLCCDPGDAVLVPEPSYPLFEYLARLEGVTSLGYRLAFDGEWHIDFASLDDAAGGRHRPRAVVVVNPNNPTGSYLKQRELERLVAFCAERDLALVSDEVFAPYALGTGSIGSRAQPPRRKPATRPRYSAWAVCRRPAGSPPQARVDRRRWPRGGTVAGGAGADRGHVPLGVDPRPARAARVAGRRRGDPPAHRRPRRRQSGHVERRAAGRVGVLAACRRGGWSAVLRVPAHPTDGDWAVSLAREASVLVHPGYFFDMRGGTFVIVSLLPAPETFASGIARVVSHIDASLR